MMKEAKKLEFDHLPAMPDHIEIDSSENHYIKVEIVWKCVRNQKCDLDVNAYLFDRQGTLLETIDFFNRLSSDSCVHLQEDALPGGDTEEDLEDSEEIFMHLLGLSQSNRVRCMVISATHMCGDLSPVAGIHVYCTRVRFLRGALQSQNNRASSVAPNHVPLWQGNRVIESRPLFQLRQKITEAQQISSKTLKAVQALQKVPSGPPRERENNILLFRLLKDPDSLFWYASKCVQVFGTSAGDQQRAAKIAQMSLVDLFPWLKPSENHALPSIPAVCSALTSHSLPKLKKYFTRSKNGLGLGADDFVKVLFKQLYKEEARLRDPREAEHGVAMLYELFNQIDMDGNKFVDWEEFTSFCIEIGMVTSDADHVTQIDDYKIEYINDNNYTENIQHGYNRTIAVMVHIPEHGTILTVEPDSSTFKGLDSAGRIVHSFTLREIGENSPAQVPQQEDKSEFIITDIVYCPEIRKIAVATNNAHMVVCLLEELTGSVGQHKDYHLVSIKSHNCSHHKLCWSNIDQRLYSVSEDYNIWYWPVDETTGLFEEGPGRHILNRSKHNNDMIMDFICLKDKGMLATACMDTNVRLWGSENFRIRAMLEGHKRGVRALAYAQNVLVSAGFEYDAIAWDVTAREELCRLHGHRSSITDVAMLSKGLEYEVLVVTADDCGEFRVWDLTGTGTGDGHAMCTDVFQVLKDAHVPVSRFVCPYDDPISIGQYSNIVAAGLRLFHLIPRKIMKEFVPPTALSYNVASAHFVSSVSRTLHIWDSNTGSYLRSFSGPEKIGISDSDIVSMCIDQPRQRRVILGSESGEILLINYVTGTVLDKKKNHTREVTSLQFCTHSQCFISTGADGTIHVYEELISSFKLLRSVILAHGTKNITDKQLLSASKRLSTLVESQGTPQIHFLKKKDHTLTGEKDGFGAQRPSGANNFSFSTSSRFSSMSGSRYSTTVDPLLELLRTPEAIPATPSPHSRSRSPSLTLVSTDKTEAEEEEKKSSEEVVGIVSSAYSDRLSLLVTGGADGTVNIWEYSNLELYATVDQAELKDTGPMLAIMDPYSFILVGGARGIYLWHFNVETHKLRALSCLAVEGTGPQTALSCISYIPYSSEEEAESQPNKKGYFSDDGIILACTESGDVHTWSTLETLNKVCSTLSEDEKIVMQKIEDQNCSGFRSTSTTKLKLVRDQSNYASYSKHHKFRTKSSERIPSERTWKAHLETIVKCTHIPSPLCIITISYDGFTRLWSKFGEVIGEFQLPNLDETRRNSPLCRDPIDWKYAPNELKITSNHKKIAKELLEFLTFKFDDARSRTPQRALIKVKNAATVFKIFSRQSTSRNSSRDSVRNENGKAEQPGFVSPINNLNCEPRPLSGFGNSLISTRSGTPDQYGQSLSPKPDQSAELVKKKLEQHQKKTQQASVSLPDLTRPLAKSSTDFTSGQANKKSSLTIKPPKKNSLSGSNQVISQSTGSLPQRKPISRKAKLKKGGISDATSQSKRYSKGSLPNSRRSTISCKEQLQQRSRSPSSISSGRRVSEFFTARTDSTQQSGGSPKHSVESPSHKEGDSRFWNSQGLRATSPKMHTDARAMYKQLSVKKDFNRSTMGQDLARPESLDEESQAGFSFSTMTDHEIGDDASLDNASIDTQEMIGHSLIGNLMVSSPEGRLQSIGDLYQMKDELDAERAMSPKTHSRAKKDWEEQRAKFLKEINVRNSATFVREEMFPAEQRLSTSDAFSDASIVSGINAGIYDMESFKTLRKISKRKGDVNAYERSFPQIKPARMREQNVKSNPEHLKVRTFGPGGTRPTSVPALPRQVSQYKHAAVEFERAFPSNLHLWETLKGSKHVDTRKVGTLTASQKDGGIFKGDVISDYKEEAEEEEDEDEKKKASAKDQYVEYDENTKKVNWVSKQAKQRRTIATFNRDRQKSVLQINKLKSRVQLDIHSTSDAISIDEKEQQKRKAGSITARMLRRQAMEQKVTKDALLTKITALIVKSMETRRSISITKRSRASTRSSRSKNNDALSDRIDSRGFLGPHYSLDRVRQFRDAFNYVDEDFSGQLEYLEWEMFLRRFDSKISQDMIRRNFLLIDKDYSGAIDMSELMPILFDKATPEQCVMMIRVVQHDNMKLQKGEPDIDILTLKDVENLFGFYDTEKKGAVTLEVLKKIFDDLKLLGVLRSLLKKKIPSKSKPDPNHVFTFTCAELYVLLHAAV